MRAGLADLAVESHSLDDLERGAADVDGVAAGAQPIGALDQYRPMSAPGQPVRQRGASDAGARYQDGGWRHGLHNGLGLSVMDGYAYDTALLILRVCLGLTMAAHGYNKFFGGGRIPGTARWFESIGMKPGTLHARIAATTEMSAGLGLAVGLLTPIPAAGFVALMLVAAWTVHRPNGFFIVKEGWEYNLVLAVTAVGIATLGAGQFSLDYAFFSGTGFYNLLHGWWGFLIAAGLGLAGGIGQLVLFYRPPQPADAN